MRIKKLSWSVCLAVAARLLEIVKLLSPLSWYFQVDVDLKQAKKRRWAVTTGPSF
jgi:hypothetical protein